MGKLSDWLDRLERALFAQGEATLPLSHAFGPWQHAERAQCAAIERLAAGDVSAIPLAYDALSGDDDDLARAAAAALCAALARLTFDETVRVARLMRESGQDRYAARRAYGYADLLSPNMTDGERRAVTVFASLDPSGYVREEAVRRLGSLEGTLAYILIRRCDWVAQVRAAAEEAYQRRLAGLTADELLAALPYAEKYAGQDALRQAMALLAREAFRPALQGGLRSRDIRTRRLCIRALLGPDMPSPALAMRHLRYEREPRLRAMLFRGLIAHDAYARAAADALLRDRHPQNRMLAFEYLQTAGAEDMPSVAKALLVDRNAVVRKMARAAMAALVPAFDCGAFYRAGIAGGYPPAILGLGEVGMPEDAALVAGYLQSGVAMAANAAMVALMRLDAQAYAAAVIAMLDSDRRSTVKQAAGLVVQYRLVNHPQVKAVYTRTASAYTKMKCARLLAALPNKWDRLVFLLECLDDEALRAFAQARILLWVRHYNKAFVGPTAAQRACVQSLLAQHQPHLPPDTFRFISFTLP